jgi:DNA-binding beta-propeller fold protein YncE
MRSLLAFWCAISFAAIHATPFALGQDVGSERLRSLLKATPDLALESTEVSVDPSIALIGISSVAADQQENLYVIHRPDAGDPIVVLDRSGHLLRSWGKGMFHVPHSIRIDAAGAVWAIDANTSTIYKFTPQGKKLLEINVGGVPDTAQEFCGATDIAFAKNGHLFVADGYCNARVIEYDTNGKKLKEWGSHGSGPGEFQLVHSIAIGPDGNVYVADRENGRIQWFDQQGKFLGQWKYGGQLHSLAFTKSGDLYAVLHPKGVAPEKESYLVKIDRSTGALIGKYAVRSHELGIAPDGTLLPATRSNQLLLLKQRQ